MLDIVKRRYLYFGISLLVIVPGLIALLIWGFPLAIDFTGGSLLQIQFDLGYGAHGSSDPDSLQRFWFRQFTGANH